MWDVASAKKRRCLRGHSSRVDTAAFSPDGQRLASAGTDAIVIAWDAATGKKRLSLRGHGSKIFGVAFSRDGRRLASASGDGYVRIWGISSNDELAGPKEAVPGK
jgi:WD40 repeat protein